MSRECLVMLQNLKKRLFPRLLEILFCLQLHKRRKNFQGYLEFKGVVIIQNATANLNKGILLLYLSETSAMATGYLLGLLSINRLQFITSVYFLNLPISMSLYKANVKNGKERRREMVCLEQLEMWQCILGKGTLYKCWDLLQPSWETNNLFSVWQIPTRIVMYLSVNQKLR